MNREHARLIASPDGAGKDIFGTWRLDCPEITEHWCHNADLKDSNIIWRIHPPVMHDAELCQCSFKQIIVDGVMRINWKSVLERNNWRNRKNKFTFRGRGTGDGGIFCDDEWNKGWITFTSEHECYGMFETQYGDKPWSFTGKKVSLKMAGKTPYALREEYKRLELGMGVEEEWAFLTS